MNNGQRTPPARERPVQPPPLPLRIRRPNNRPNIAADPFAGLQNRRPFQMNPGGSPGRRKSRKGRKNRSKKTRKN